MASHLPRKEKRRVPANTFFGVAQTSPYYSTTDEDSARQKHKKCLAKGLHTRPYNCLHKQSTHVISENKQMRVAPIIEKAEKKASGECRRQCATPSKILNTTKNVFVDGVKSQKPMCKNSSLHVPWESSVEHLNVIVEDNLCEKAKQRFCHGTNKVRDQCQRKSNTDSSYDHTKLPKSSTRNLLDSAINEMLWTKKCLNKRNHHVTVPQSNRVDDHERLPRARTPISISKYIENQKQMKFKQSRQGQKSFSDKELCCNQENSFRLNLHDLRDFHDVFDRRSMQQEMTSEEKKILGCYPNPPYRDECRIGNIKSEFDTVNANTKKGKTIPTNASRSDGLLCQLGLYSGSELSEQSTPRGKVDTNSAVLASRYELTKSCTENEETESIGSELSGRPQIGNITEQVTGVRDEKCNTPLNETSVDDDYMIFRSILDLSRENTITEEMDDNNEVYPSNSTEDETEYETASTEEYSEESGEEIANENTSKNIAGPSVFLPEMIPDPSFTLKIKEHEVSEAGKIDENMNASPEIVQANVESENQGIQYISPNTKELYEELDKWRKLVNPDEFRRSLKGPGLRMYLDSTAEDESAYKKSQNPKSNATVFEEVYKKYILNRSNSKTDKDPEENCKEMLSSKVTENKKSNDSVEVVNVDCIYKSPTIPHRFPLQIISEEESQCEVDFGQPLITKNWLYNLLLKPSSIYTESIKSNDEAETCSVITAENGQVTNEFTTDSQSDYTVEETDECEEDVWLEPVVDWDNVSPCMVYNIMQLTGGFLTDVYSQQPSQENCNYYHDTSKTFISAFEPANLCLQTSSVVSIEEINSPEGEEETVLAILPDTPSDITVIERKINSEQKLPIENAQILETENFLENENRESNEIHANGNSENTNVPQTGRRRLPYRIAFGIYGRLRSMRTSLSKMMSGMKNYFRVNKGVIRKVSPLGSTHANRIKFLKEAPHTFNTFSDATLLAHHAKPSGSPNRTFTL